LSLPAYWVARARVNNAEEYKKYTDLVPAIIAKHEGRVLARGGPFKILEGTDKYHRFIVIEFPSLEAAVACHQSEEYQKAARFRRDGVGDNELIIVEGVPTETGG
jgi:uncharacterized protein (DUF1330 family)